jgi:cell division protein FtsQ
MTVTANRRGPSSGAPGSADPSGPPRSSVPGGNRLLYLVGGSAAAILVVVWLIAFSPALGARTVTVTGAHTLTADQVRTAAAISNGAPLIRLDTAAVRRRIEALPDVAAASVSVAYPSTVRIRITERVPVGYLTAAGGFALVDATGLQYRTVAVAPAGLPRFTLPTGASIVSTGRAVADVAAALSTAVRAQLVQVSADSPQSITLVLRDGRTVLWGSSERNEQKAALLPALLTQPGQHFDVSNPDFVIAR